jgi:hypothetical protein
MASKHGMQDGMQDGMEAWHASMEYKHGMQAWNTSMVCKMACRHGVQDGMQAWHGGMACKHGMQDGMAWESATDGSTSCPSGIFTARVIDTLCAA